MFFLDQLERINRIHNLVKNRRTGSPENLASILSISERQVYNIIKKLKIRGAPIKYDRVNETYFYENENFDITTD